MIAIWFIPKKNKCYAKVLRGAYFNRRYKVGYINQYNHVLIALFYVNKYKIIQCDSLADYYNNKKSFKVRTIDKIINFLNKLKK